MRDIIKKVLKEEDKRRRYIKSTDSLRKVITLFLDDYIEDGNFNTIVGVPDYAYFSTSQNTFRWRDLYPYGFVDSTGLGYDYPFLNGVHYPYDNYTFRIIPEGTNYTEQTIITQPTIDNCE